MVKTKKEDKKKSEDMESKKKSVKKNNRYQTLVQKIIDKGKHPVLAAPRTFGQRAADNLAKWAGSWVFIIGFLIFLVIWMTLNTAWILFGKTWDPFPFILLNLVLSCLAAIQAPVILMSQNRTAQKDRQRAEYDYAVNRKSEREIQEMKKQLSRIERKLK